MRKDNKLETNIENTSVFEIAMMQLDKIQQQKERGIIGGESYNTQRLIILIDLIINHKKVTEKGMVK
jgi:hypothetical protein